MTGTAKIYTTTLSPEKLDLLKEWLPGQEWFDGDVGSLREVGRYRLVDPGGEVGIETFLLADSTGTTWHVPVTYRSEPVPDGEAVGTIMHGVLGQRHVTFGPSDPVYVACARTAIAEKYTEAALSTGDEPTAHALGSGVDAPGDTRLVVARKTSAPVEGRGRLTVRWTQDGTERSAVLAALV